MNRYLQSTIVLMIVLILSALPSLAVQYRVEPLGTLGGGFDRARAVSSSADIVGEALIPGDGSIEHAFLWHDGQMVDLGTLGGSRSRALDVNASRCVVGWSTDSTGATRPVYWDEAGRIHDLATLGGRSGSAWAVNESGVAVGVSSTSGGASHATAWSALGPSDLGTLGGVYSIAYDVNILGTVVGGAYDASGWQQACLWGADGLVNLGSLSGGSWSAARCVNDAGQVILWGKPAGVSDNHAAFWDGASDTVVDLGTFGGNESWAYGLNNLGHVVGWAKDPQGIYRAFVYNGVEMIDLGTLGGLFSSAYSISDDGIIAGYAMDAGGTWQAVRWVPVPEPSSLAIVVAALVGNIVLLSHKRRAKRPGR